MTTLSACGEFGPIAALRLVAPRTIDPWRCPDRLAFRSAAT